MGKLSILLTLMALLLPVAAQPPLVPNETENAHPAGVGNTVLVFLPQQLFSSDEYEGVTRTLARSGVYFKLVAPDSGVCAGLSGVVVMPDFALADARPADFAGIVLIGGPGHNLYWDDSLLHARCREFEAAGKVVAAIGIAPITLARAGLLAGRHATVASDPYAVKFIREKGARYRFKPVEVDGRVVTASDATQARDFARAVAKLVRSGAKVR